MPGFLVTHFLKMLFFVLALTSLVTSKLAAAAAAAPNALTLLKQQKDVTIITRLIERDPLLTKLYTEATNVTIFDAVDSGFDGFT